MTKEETPDTVQLPTFDSLVPRVSTRFAMGLQLEPSGGSTTNVPSLLGNHIFTSGKEVVAYWFWVRSKYEVMAADLLQKVMTLEPPELRWVVAAIIDTLSEHLGYLIASVNEKGLHIDGVHLDHEVIAIIAGNLKASYSVVEDDRVVELFTLAFEWLRSWMDGKSSVGVAWAIGPAKLADGRDIRFSDSDRIVYSTKLGRVVGVGSHPSATRPGYFIWEIPESILWPAKPGDSPRGAQRKRNRR